MRRRRTGPRSIAGFLHKTQLAKRYGFELLPGATIPMDGRARRGVKVRCRRCEHQVLYSQTALQRRHATRCSEHAAFA